MLIRRLVERIHLNIFYHFICIKPCVKYIVYLPVGFSSHILPLSLKGAWNIACRPHTSQTSLIRTHTSYTMKVDRPTPKRIDAPQLLIDHGQHRWSFYPFPTPTLISKFRPLWAPTLIRCFDSGPMKESFFTLPTTLFSRSTTSRVKFRWNVVNFCVWEIHIWITLILICCR